MSNVKQFPTEVVDRVAKTAGAIVKILELSDIDPSEDHLAALLLVQTAIQEAVMREKGPIELRRVLIAANEKRKRYDIKWNYSPKDSKVGSVRSIKDDPDE